MADFRFDASAGRYRGEDGKFITFKAVRDAVDRVTDLASSQLGTLAVQLRAGEISLPDWQRQSMAVIKDGHVAVGMAAHGGIRQMDSETWGFIGQRIRAEYDYLRAMAAQIASGEQPLNGRFEARARQYGQAARATFASVEHRDHEERGTASERSVLSAAEHCDTCKAQAGLGWVALGTLIPIGARSCRSNCRCRFEYRGQEVQAA